MSAPVIIIGAGPAGTRAALDLAAAGERPIVIDEQSRSGGQIYRRPPSAHHRRYEDIYGTESAKARRLHGEFDAAVAAEKIAYRPDTTAWAVHSGKLFLETAGSSDAVTYGRLLLATGAVERVVPVQGWTLPGVFSLGGAQIALKAQGCAIGDRVAFVGTGPLLYLVALQYAQAGAEVVGVFDTSPFRLRVAAARIMASRPEMLWRGLVMTARLKYRHRVPIFTGIRPLAVTGDEAVTGLRYRDAQGRELEIACTGVGMGYDLRPEVQIADLARCEMVYNPSARNWEVRVDEYGRTSVEDIYVAGDGLRIAGADAAEIAGRLAAHAILSDMGREVDDVEPVLREAKRYRRFRDGINAAFPPPVDMLADTPGDVLLCRCEGVSIAEFKRSVGAMQAREINRAKSMTRCGMGRCQGRFCEFAAAEILAQTLHVERHAVGRLRAQAPAKPVILTGEERQP